MPYHCLMVVNPACIRCQKEQMQFSVYARVCNGNDAVKKHEGRLRASLPPNGSIRLLVVTEKQYQSIQILLGNYQPEDAPFACEQLSFF